MTESKPSAPEQRELETGAARQPWTAPTLRELDAHMTRLSAGVGVDGGGESTSAS